MGVPSRVSVRDAVGWLAEIIGPDAAYLRLAAIYGVAISLLSLATPISVQLLINSVAHTALPAPLWTLSGVLFGLLLLVAVLSAFRVHLMALFERRIFARVVAEITIRAVHARDPFFGDTRRGDLFNRYFDLAIVQKAVPSLLIGGFTIVLQSAVGLAVTSFYHPFFLAFNVVLLLALLLVWLLWSRGSLTAAVALSHAKHDTARWLESVGSSNGFYKSSRHLNFAMDRSEAATKTYVDQHRRYFRYSFAQTLACFLLYAFASAALLALGGNLILAGELSIGQLVSAELILSGVFYGISQLGWYLDTFYDLVASSEELSLVFAIPQEHLPTTSRQGPQDGAIALRSVRLDNACFDFAVKSGEQLVTVPDPGADRLLAVLLKRHVTPEHGLVTVGGSDLGGLDMYLLRSEVVVLDRPTIVEVTIREYLSLAAPEASAAAMLDALDAVGLSARITSLGEGLDTPLASSGWPLTAAEVMQLKLANALLACPKVLVLSTLFDVMPPRRLREVLARLKTAGTTVLLCTGRPGAIALDGWLWLGREGQRRFASQAELDAFLAEREAALAVPS
ncbi:ABC transporter transmembrane domain-containing protein [Sphingomonas radiodurans]|uniref:ABC transporter transmembrane domain-containing protein n=1 Tax=Sphingomonas radiodurans TaxID=2890321 RepID=UPI001E290607|nr:ABC transporter transmembrane domain-containing protein [Sphingomonas radiodurans]WBH17977.1 ABC transporter transmembrane domain-containing protein [Sphingomonas radiodurans]